MLKKTRILDGQNRIFHHLGDVLNGRQITALFTKLADQCIVSRVDTKR